MTTMSSHKVSDFKGHSTSSTQKIRSFPLLIIKYIFFLLNTSKFRKESCYAPVVP